MPSSSLVVWGLVSFVLLAGLSEAVPRGVVPIAVESATPVTAYSEVPLTYDDSTFVLVPVSIGGQDSLQFVLDTAAGSTVLTPWAADTLGIDTESAGAVTVSGASGEASYPRLRLDALQVGDEVIRGLTVPVIDLDRFEQTETRYAGILGNDVLRNFDVVIDLPNERLRLYPLAGRGASPVAGLDTLQAIPFKGASVYGGSGFVRMPLSIGDGEAEAILDTGARQTVFNWQAAALDGATRATVRKRETGTRGLTEEGETETYLYTFADVRPGRGEGAMPFRPAEVRIADLPVFQRLRMADGPAVILGNDVIADRVVVIAYSTRAVYL